jgi:hypothetical protein
MVAVNVTDCPTVDGLNELVTPVIVVVRVIVIDNCADACCRLGVVESLAVTVKTYVNTWAPGVPVMAPVNGSSDRPPGNRPPVTAQVTGAVPPADIKVAPGYGTLSCPSGNDVVVTTSAPEVKVIDRLACATCAVGVPESVAVTATVDVPAGPVGVPLTAPVDAFSDNPAGRPVCDHVTAPVPPVDASVAPP